QDDQQRAAVLGVEELLEVAQLFEVLLERPLGVLRGRVAAGVAGGVVLQGHPGAGLDEHEHPRAGGGQAVTSSCSAASMTWRVSAGPWAARSSSTNPGRSISRASRAITPSCVRSSRQQTRKKMSV